MAQIAVLGTGLLGTGFAVRALANGHQVRVWNRTPAKCASIVAEGGVQGETPADTVAGCERVHLVLSADDAVDSVIEAMKPGLHPDAWIVDHSTNLPERVAMRCARLRLEGIQYIHAPVFMGPSHSREGSGQMLISGPETSIGVLRPALEEMTGTLSAIGPRDEDAAVHKILGNGLIIGLSALGGDLLKAARASGFRDEQTLAALRLFSPMTSRMAARVAGHHTSETTFRLDMASKDIGLLLRAGAASPLSVLPGLGESMDAHIRAGCGRENYTVAFASETD
jgi:3-hydroxyisobutyrate dehydrogenase